MAQNCNNCPQDSKFKYKLIHTNGHESEVVTITLKNLTDTEEVPRDPMRITKFDVSQDFSYTSSNPDPVGRFVIEGSNLNSERLSYGVKFKEGAYVNEMYPFREDLPSRVISETTSRIEVEVTIPGYNGARDNAQRDDVFDFYLFVDGVDVAGTKYKSVTYYP